MSTKDFYSDDWGKDSGTATGLMEPGESMTVSGGIGIYGGLWIPEVGNIYLDYTSFPVYPLYKYKITVERCKQDSGYDYYFTDESGDTYKLTTISHSPIATHEVSYNSDQPNIVEVRWEPF